MMTAVKNAWKFDSWKGNYIVHYLLITLLIIRVMIAAAVITG
jgi:hypothetical protein